MQNLFLVHQQLVIVLVATCRIRLLRTLEVHPAQLKWQEVIWSRSLRNPYVEKFDDPMTHGCQGKKVSLSDKIFTASKVSRWNL